MYLKFWTGALITVLCVTVYFVNDRIVGLKKFVITIPLVLAIIFFSVLLYRLF